MFSKITIIFRYEPSKVFYYGSFMKNLRKLSREFNCNLSVKFSEGSISVSFHRNAIGEYIPVLEGASLFHNVIAFVEVIVKEEEDHYANLQFADVNFDASLPF